MNQRNIRILRVDYVRKILSVSAIRKGSSEIWSDKLKVLYNRHTESRRDGGNAISRRCRRHKEQRRCSVQILDNFWDKYFGYKVTKKVCRQAPSLYAPTMPPRLPSLFLIILRPLLFSVWHFVRNLTLSGKTYHSKILKTLRKVGNDSEVLVTPWIFLLLRNRQQLGGSQAP